MQITRCDRCFADIPIDEVPSYDDQHAGNDLCRKCLSAFDRWMLPCRECGHHIEDHLGTHDCTALLDEQRQVLCGCDDFQTWAIPVKIAGE